MPFDFSAFRSPRPEEKPGLGSGAMVDPRGGINPSGIMPPKPGGFLSPMVGGMPAPPPMSMAPKPPMMSRPIPPRPMGMAPRVTPPARPGTLGIRRRTGMF